MRQVKALDVYPKTLSEFSERTPVGGAISIGAIVLICALTLSQLAAYFTVRTVDHLVVDVERERLIRIDLNLTFPALPCAAIGLVTMDVAGEQQIDVAQNVRKVRLSALDGQPLADQEAAEGSGSREAAHAALAAVGLADLPDGAERCGLCYTDPNLQAQFLRAVRQTTETAHAAGQPIAPGSASLCCNSCDDVRETYGRIRIVPPPTARAAAAGGVQMDWRAHPLCAHDAQLIDPGALGGVREGCAVEGFLHVNKVAGNFHIAPGRAFASPQGHLVHEFKPFAMGAYNTTHAIHSLSFGPRYPNQVNPLDGVRKVVADGSGLFQYYIKVVPTSYTRADASEPIASCQYSVTEAERLVGAEGRPPGQFQFVLPGVFFIYDISPIMVQYREETTSLWTFLTSLCAIVGGVFVVAGMLDSALHALADKGGGGGLKLAM